MSAPAAGFTRTSPKKFRSKSVNVGEFTAGVDLVWVGVTGIGVCAGDLGGVDLSFTLLGVNDRLLPVAPVSVDGANISIIGLELG